MTTLAGYFDTLTRRRLDAAPGFWNRALAPRHQRVALLVLVHVAAALKHHFVDGDGLMSRMLPGRD